MPSTHTANHTATRAEDRAELVTALAGATKHIGSWEADPAFADLLVLLTQRFTKTLHGIGIGWNESQRIAVDAVDLITKRDGIYDAARAAMRTHLKARGA